MQAVEYNGGILADFLGIEETDVHLWGDGSYTIGTDTTDYYVLDEVTDKYAEYIGRHRDGYHIYRN
jgi:hypothetical protein